MGTPCMHCMRAQVTSVKRFLEIQNGKRSIRFAPKEEPTLEWKTSVSLDHAIYFHRARDVRCDEWNLIHCETLIGVGGRGLSRAEVYNREYRVLASYQQEVLTRHRV